MVEGESYNRASLQGDRLRRGEGTCWGEEPLYKGQVGEWSLSTRDRLGSGASLQGTGWEWSLSTRDRLGSGASLQGTGWGVEPLYKGQVGEYEWNLSTRDRLGRRASLQGTSWGVEPLYKGQVIHTLSRLLKTDTNFSEF